MLGDQSEVRREHYVPIRLVDFKELPKNKQDSRVHPRQSSGKHDFWLVGIAK